MFLPEIEEEEDEDASAPSAGARTPKTSILSLHKAGLPAAGQPTTGTGTATGTGTGSSSTGSNKGHRPAEGIWR